MFYVNICSFCFWFVNTLNQYSLVKFIDRIIARRKKTWYRIVFYLLIFFNIQFFRFFLFVHAKELCVFFFCSCCCSDFKYQQQNARHWEKFVKRLPELIKNAKFISTNYWKKKKLEKRKIKHTTNWYRIERHYLKSNAQWRSMYSSHGNRALHIDESRSHTITNWCYRHCNEVLVIVKTMSSFSTVIKMPLQFLCSLWGSQLLHLNWKTFDNKYWIICNSKINITVRPQLEC